MSWKHRFWVSGLGIGMVIGLLTLTVHAQQSPTRETLTIGFYGSAESPAAQGLSLAIEQSNLDVIGGKSEFPYYLKAVISDDPRELSATVAVFALPHPQNTTPVTWTMPVFLLSPTESLVLPQIQATLWRGMTSQADLDEMLFDFLFVQSAAGRVMLIGQDIELLNTTARLQTLPNIAMQQQPSTLLTSADFQNLLKFNPQVVVYAGDPVSAAALIEALGETGWSGYFIYADWAALFALDDFVMPAGVYVVDSSFWVSSSPDSLSQGLTAAYQEKYDALPTAEAAAAYDLTWAVRLLIQRHGVGQLLNALPTTAVIRTTSGEINPAVYGNQELYRSGMVYTWLNATETRVLARYDNGQVVNDSLVASFATGTPAPSPTPAYYTFTVTNTTLNVHTGPADDYQIIGQLTRQQEVQIVGELKGGRWYLVQSPYGLGWVMARLGTVFAPQGMTLPQLDSPPPPTPLPTATLPIITATPRAPEVSFAPPASASKGFELGGQVISQDATPLMRSIGMTWLKEQVRWEIGETADKAARGAIQTAHSNGMKMLVGSMGWTYQMGDFDTYLTAYVNYLRQVAALGPDAIEVWNEPNIALEWQAGTINGANYTRMLREAYTAIKSVNPNIMVISAALAPTGFFKGCSDQGCDDDVFLRQMAEAGAGRYLDCVGVHYNEAAVSPSLRTGDPRGSHHSYYLPAMIDLYSSVFPGKPLCFTELGYLSGEDIGGLPSNFGWASGITLAEHAQWLGEAVNVTRQSGKVRMMVIWNVNFRDTSELPWAGWAIMRINGACPACDVLKKVMGVP